MTTRRKDKPRTLKVWVSPTIDERMASKEFMEPRGHIYATRFFKALVPATLTLLPPKRKAGK